MHETSRVLVVVRHARAEASAHTDFERDLAPRGAEDAREAGEWLADQGFVPDHAWVSAAYRAVETWEALTEGGGWHLAAERDRGLYSAGAETALDLIRSTPPEARALVVVGHNPTMHTVAATLDDGEGDADAVLELAGGFPTCAVAVFSYDGAWADLSHGAATLTAFHVGRA